MVLLIASVFVAYGTVIDNRWYTIVAIEGGSMTPTIQPGDAIVITRPPEQIEVGMILTLQVEGQVVTHRVVEVDASRFMTQGDANDAPDNWEGLNIDVVGRYWFRLPWLGRFIGG